MNKYLNDLPMTMQMFADGHWIVWRKVFFLHRFYSPVRIVYIGVIHQSLIHHSHPSLRLEEYYFVQKNADIAMVTIPYESVVPYGVVELNDNNVLGITEKPSFTHYANAGIYLMKKEIFRKIPKT